MLPEHWTLNINYILWTIRRSNDSIKLYALFLDTKKGLIKKPICFIFTLPMTSIEIQITEIKFILMTFETDFQCFHTFFRYRVTKTFRIFKKKKEERAKVSRWLMIVPRTWFEFQKRNKKIPIKFQFRCLHRFLFDEMKSDYSIVW